VYPTDIESVILEHPEVREAAVVGIPHDVLGEDIAAFVVRKPDAAVGGDDLRAFCANHLADYKRPRQVTFVDELPRNATGKVMKHLLGGESAPTTSRKSS
jgi:acyl-CoA synthetase (AMP-forming)/AMP-acid ligase II